MLLVAFTLAIAGQGPAEWHEPFPAHRIVGHTYYVGSKDLATYLITTPAGHILINSGFERTVPLIQKAVESLGFKMTDVKVLLASHAHSDHVAGHARLQKLTGAKVFVMRGDDDVIASGGKGQYLYGRDTWAPCKVDRVLRDRDEVKLGGVTLTARRTPGHTRGCTTWTWQAEEGGRKYNLVVIGSPNVNPGYQLVNNDEYPGIADDFATTFNVLRSLPCDVFLGAHGGYYGMVEKHARLKATKGNPFVDPKGYREYVAQKERAYRKTLAEQQDKAWNVRRDVPYVEKGHERQVLDVFAPKKAKNLPVVFWIHGGGWQTGDKSDVQIKPQVFIENGFVFVSTNYRLYPSVDMGTIIRDVAKAIRWAHDHVAEYGGDPKRLLVMGHSAGAQLAAIVCTDGRYLKAEGLSLDIVKGCVPVDGDTYDVPAMIEVAEVRSRVHGFPLPGKFGHRMKFGNDPAKHKDFSAVTHVAKDRGIPPFLILHVADHPDVTAQARRLGEALKTAGVPVTVYGARETNHTRLSAELGRADDPPTRAMWEFLARVLKK